MSPEKCIEFLRLADVFFEPNEDDPPEFSQILNMNDTFGWALSMGESVPDEKLNEVVELYKKYGWCGLVYWVSEQHNQMKSEFEDINRFINFVKHEENLIKDVPDSNKRAYRKLHYKL